MSDLHGGKDPLVRIAKRNDMARGKRWCIRLGAIVLALVVGSLFVAVLGHNPIDIYKEIINGSLGGPSARRVTVRLAIPLLGDIAYQAGYLTLEKREGQMLTLDYPNREVLDSLSAMYAELVYNVNDAGNAGLTLWEAFAANDLELVKRLYNAALASIPYEYFGDAREDFYKAIFLTLLRGAGINSLGELHNSRGRSDVEVLLPDAVYVIEFKTAADGHAVESKRSAGDAQISDRGYAERYAADTRRIVTTTFVIDLEKRQTV